MNGDGNSLEIFNEATESILIKNEEILFMIEYAQNKLFVTVDPTCMLLIDDWVNVKCIQDPNSTNTLKTFAFKVSNFDEETLPFIAVCGESNLSILNVKECYFQTLFDQKMSVGRSGL